MEAIIEIGCIIWQQVNPIFSNVNLFLCCMEVINKAWAWRHVYKVLCFAITDNMWSVSLCIWCYACKNCDWYPQLCSENMQTIMLSLSCSTYWFHCINKIYITLVKRISPSTKLFILTTNWTWETRLAKKPLARGNYGI